VSTMKLLSLFLPVLLLAQPATLNYFHPTGLPGVVTDPNILSMPDLSALPPNFRSPDIDLKLMGSWALRHLTNNPRPSLDYEPVFFIRPMQAPPTPEGHDAIVPGDTDCRMDWEFPYMREILGLDQPSAVERGLRKRILGYVQRGGLAWVSPGHYMEGDVYQGKEVGNKKVVSTWATAKILRSLSETYRRSKDEQARRQAREMFVALRGLAEWNTGRAYYPGGSGAWLDGKWIKPQVPTAAVEPLVTYWEATADPEALQFARAVADGLLADAELLPKAGARILPSGEFHGHMHSTLHGVWGVAHLGAATSDMRYVNWAKDVYDYANQFGTGTGWISAALWSDAVRELSETCATSDMVSIASWLAKAGFPEYWDHVERTLRNYLRPQQFFVTAEYEALYRKLNAGKPTAQVEAGLGRMKELQAASWAGRLPMTGSTGLALPINAVPTTRLTAAWGCLAAAYRKACGPYIRFGRTSHPRTRARCW